MSIGTDFSIKHHQLIDYSGDSDSSIDPLSLENILKSLKPKKKKVIDFICKVIQNPGNYFAVDGGDGGLTATQKIKGCLSLIKRESIDIREQSELPTLNHSERIPDLIYELIKSKKESLQLKYYHALVTLAKSDPSLDPLVHEARNFLFSKDPVQVEEARTRLWFYFKCPLNSFLFPLPMTPLVPKNPESYEAILPSPTTHFETLSKPVECIAIGHFAKSYFHNLQNIAKNEGFQIIRPFKPVLNETPWIRDPLLTTEENYLLPAKLNIVSKQDPSNFKLDKALKALYGNCPSFNGDRMGAVAKLEDLHKNLLHFEYAKEAPFYFEGGNMFKVKNKLGEEIYLVGANNILFSLLNANYLFSNKPGKESILNWIIKNEGGSALKNENVVEVAARLEKAGFLSGYSEEEMHLAAKYAIAAGHVILERMERELGKEVIVIGDIFEPPIAYHLDMFLMPSLNGQIFIQSYDYCIKLLRHVLENFTLTESERCTAENYLKEAIEKDKHFSKDLARISKKLRASGFDPIPVPGVFYDDSQAVVVFLNGIIGQGSKNTFCITNGSSNSLDRYLREAFALILNQYGIKNVYFTGRKKSAKTWQISRALREYRAADKSLSYGGGIHCRTLELDPEQKVFLQDPTPKRNGEKRGDPNHILDSFPHFLEKMLAFQNSSGGRSSSPALLAQ